MRIHNITRFMLFGAAGALCAALIYGAFRPTAAPPDPNIILITVDALRADHLGCYGYRRDTSPHIDQLAREGVRFTQAISQGSWTGESLFSLMTSNYAHTNGIGYWGDRLNPESPAFALVLQQNGYATRLINGHPGAQLLAQMGISRGFDQWTDATQELRADEVTRQAIGFLTQHRNRKFFLWLHYFDPHGPYAPPAPYNNRYRDDGMYRTAKHIPISTAQDSPWLSLGKIPYNIQDNNITDVDHYIARYDGEIRFTDEQIGVLLNTLKNLHLAENTLIVLTADHGEGMGEHDNYFTHGVLYDEIIKVPFIIKAPHRVPAGKVIAAPVGHIDLMPTVIQGFLRLNPPVSMEGINLLPLIRGQVPPPASRAIFSELSATVDSDANMISIVMRQDNWKLLYNMGKQTVRLYNLEKDPQELHDLGATEKETAHRMLDRLKQWLTQQKTNRTHAKPLTDDTVKNMLRSLGYM